MNTGTVVIRAGLFGFFSTSILHSFMLDLRYRQELSGTVTIGSPPVLLE